MALTDNLIAYYTMDNTSDSLSTYNLISNGATLNASGIIGSCYDLDGTNDFLYASTSLPISTAFTFSFWVYLDALVPDSAFISKRGATSNFQLGVSSADTTKLQLYLWNSAFGSTLSNTGLLETGKWIHLTVTFDGTSVTYYKNAVSFGTSTDSGNIVNDTLVTRFGEDYYAHYMNGRMDEFGIWTRAISSAEVATLYNSGNGLTYPFVSGWSKKIFGVTPSKINGIAVSGISKVNGV